MRSMLTLVLVTSIVSLSTQLVFAKVNLIPTITVVDEVSLGSDRIEIMAFIQSDKVREELIRFGVDPQEASARVASLSTEELRSLTHQIHEARAGGDFGFGSLIGAAVFVFIVLLITDILGFTKFFSFTRSVR